MSSVVLPTWPIQGYDMFKTHVSQEMDTEYSGKFSPWEEFVLVALFGNIKESFELLHCCYFFSHWSQLWDENSKKLEVNLIFPHMDLIYLLWKLCGYLSLGKTISCVATVLVGGKIKNQSILIFFQEINDFFLWSLAPKVISAYLIFLRLTLSAIYYLQLKLFLNEWHFG